MNKLLVVVLFFFIFSFSNQLEIDEAFDLNDVENEACQSNCEADQVRFSTKKETYYELHRCKACDKLFELCVNYRICQGDCVPEMPVLPYKQARDFALRVRPPMNPCLELIAACNYESMDSFHALKTENPFLFI